MANEPDNFADKVINSLIKQSKAVDLTAEVVAESTNPEVLGDIVAFGAPTGGGQGPGVGGNKDIVIVPGAGGAAATSVSQINFYWNAPATPDASGVDTNIRATIYNFATNPGSGVTRSVFAFGGYDGTNQYKPHPLYGGGTGITAKIFIDPFLGKIDTDFIGLNYSGVAATTDIGAISYDATQNRIRVGTGAGSAKTLAFTDDVSTTASIATTSQNINIVTTNTGTFYPLFTSSSTTASGAAVSIDGTDISYNAATNVLTAGQFSGLHTGTAFTATTGFYGNLTGTATTSQNAYVTAQTTGTFYPVFTNVSSTTNGVALSVESSLSWDAATNTLTSGKFSGLASGTAATFTNFYGALTGNVTGTATTAGLATTAQNVNISSVAVGTLYPLFTNISSSASGVAVSIDGTDISYDAATNTFTAGKFSGLASGTAATFTNFYGTLTGNVTGTSTTSQNINIVTANTGTFYPLFTSSSGSASGAAVSIDGTDISYNFATNTLTAGTFSGNLSATAATATNFYGTLTGSVTGTATTSQNVYVTAQTTGTFYPTLSSSSATANGVALGVDSGLSFDSATNVLTAGQFSGLVTGAAITATTGFFGTLTGTATTALNLALQTSSQNASHLVPFTLNSATSGSALSTNASFSYNPSTGVLTVGTVTGTISGIASTSASSLVNSAASNSTHYMIFSTPATSAGQAGVALSSNTNITYNPSTSVFSLGAGQATINGLTLGATSNTITTSSGNLTLNSSGGTVVIGGNLNVQGTATYIDSTTETITDPVIVLGSGAGGTHTNVTDSADRGIEYRRFSGSAITGFFGFSNASGQFTFIPNANLSAANTYTGSAGVIAANLTGTAVTATNFYGPLVGNAASATTAGLATTAQNTYVTAQTTGTFYPVFTNVSTSTNGVVLSVESALSYDAATDTLTAGKFNGLHSGSAATFTNIYGPLTGTATTAQNTYVTAQTTGTFYPVFTNVSATTNGVALSVESSLSWDAATNTLTSGKFSGLASGTAATFTNFYGTLTGNVTGTATTATNLNISTGTSGTFYPLFTNVSSTASGVAVSVDGTDISYDAATNTFTAGKFSGLASGTAATFTNFYGTLTGSVTGTATTAQNVYVTAQTTGTYYPTFSVSSATANGIALGVDSGLSWDAATDTLTSGKFVGLVSGAAITATTSFYGPLVGNVTGNLTGTATTAQNLNVVNTTTGTFYPIFSTTSSTASGVAVSVDNDISWNAATNVLTAGQFSGLVTGAAITATTSFYGPLAGTATTAQNVYVTAQTTGTFYPTFSVSSATANGIALGVDSGLSFDSATDTLTAGKFSGLASGTAATFTNFYGTLTGSVTGTATTATNLNTVAAGSAGAHYLLMSPTASGSGVAVSTDASLSYVPSTDTLTVSNIFGSGAGVTISNSAALTANSYLTIQTVAADDLSTTDFFIRGITSGAVSKFSVDANGNLRATTKSFDIEHPTKPGKRLVYGVLEGPEHGVYHRGTVEGKGELKVMLPEYWSKLVCPDYTIQLTPWGNYSVHIVEKSTEHFIISVNGNAITRIMKNIKVDYVVHGSRLDAPLEIEQ